MMSYFIALVRFDVFKDLFSPLWTFEEHVLQITIVFLWNCKKKSSTLAATGSTDMWRRITREQMEQLTLFVILWFVWLNCAYSCLIEYYTEWLDNTLHGFAQVQQLTSWAQQAAHAVVVLICLFLVYWCREQTVSQIPINSCLYKLPISG